MVVKYFLEKCLCQQTEKSDNMGHKKKELQDFFRGDPVVLFEALDLERDITK